MHYLSVAAVFKNESHILYEWIEHYLHHGVEHIYLINDFSTDKYKEILDPYIEKGVLTLYENDIVTKEVGRQTLIYEKYLRPILKDTCWLVMVDLDEFLYSPMSIDLKPLLKQLEGYSQLLVDWVHFGSNGYINQPPSVVESFTMRAKLGPYPHLCGPKAILKASTITKFGIHEHTVDGQTIPVSWRWAGQNKKDPIFLINHYILQSWNFYSTVKTTRGDADNWYDHCGLSRDRKKFDEYDINEVVDMGLLSQNKDLISKVRQFKYNNRDDSICLITKVDQNVKQWRERILSTFESNSNVTECIIVNTTPLIGLYDHMKDILNTKGIPLRIIQENKWAYYVTTFRCIVLDKIDDPDTVRNFI